MRKKIVIIGAGSAAFSRGLVSDLLQNPGQHTWHLGLVDTDPEALGTITRLCRKMIQLKRAEVELSSSVDRRELLPGADYVVSTIGVGGRRAWEQDVFIPRTYGVFQAVGDSVMAGGVSRAMRMIPAMVDIARDVKALCPAARFFNYSNPMTMICRAIWKETGVAVTGLCIGVHHTEAQLARFAGIPREEVTSLAVGLNHLTFIYDFRHDGQDIFPRILEKYRNLKSGGLDLTNVGRMFAEMGGKSPTVGDPFCFELLEQLGAFAAPGDRHVTEYYAERFPGGAYHGKTLGLDAYSFEKVVEHGDRSYDFMKRAAVSPEPLPDDYLSRATGEHEQLMQIINSIEEDRRQSFSVNLPNLGAVASLPGDCILEMPGLAAAGGFRPMCLRGVPDHVAAQLLKHLGVAEVTVDAALRGDRRLFVEAVLMGGYMSDRSQAVHMVDDLLGAHARYLPQF